MVSTDVDSGFQVLTESEINAEIPPEETPEKPITPVPKFCACGCGEKVTGNRALKRGHSIATGISPQWAPEDLLVIQTALCMLLMALTTAGQQKYRVPAMTLDESQAISYPAGRIFARHFPFKKAMPGDVADGFAIVSALVSYGTRIYTARSENASDRPDAYQTVSGPDTLAQYAYRPPAPNEPKNGESH